MKVYLTLDGKERPFEKMAGAYMALAKKLDLRVTDPEVSSQLADSNYPMMLDMFWKVWLKDKTAKIRIEKTCTELNAERFILVTDLEDLTFTFSARCWTFSEAYQKLKKDTDSVLRAQRAQLNLLFNAIDNWDYIAMQTEYTAWEGSHDAKVAKIIFGNKYTVGDKTSDGTKLIFNNETVVSKDFLESEYDKKESLIADIKNIYQSMCDAVHPIDIALTSTRLNIIERQLDYKFVQVYGL